MVWRGGGGELGFINMPDRYDVPLNIGTLFLFSTSGSQSSMEKHNQALRALGVNAVYFTFNRPISAQAYADLLRSPIARGGAVTGQGLKSGIIPAVDEIDELAGSVNAINTVINKDGRLYGYNTDVYGLEAALRKHLGVSGITVKKAVIYGNGGVSGVAAHVLKSLGIEVTMAGRNPERVDKKMSDLGLSGFPGPYDLVVNATPVSAAPLAEAVGLFNILQDCKMVFDHNMPEKDNKINYLQNYCEENKLYFIPGKAMYIPQMIKQWTLFLDGIEDDEGNRIKITEEDIMKNWGIKI